jgi:precorrin-6Y C5,15-methyltransferase (decarboxylating)
VTVTQIAVSRTRPAGSLHLLMANNPIFLIAGGCYD